MMIRQKALLDAHVKNALSVPESMYFNYKSTTTQR